MPKPIDDEPEIITNGIPYSGGRDVSHITHEEITTTFSPLTGTTSEDFMSEFSAQLSKSGKELLLEEAIATVRNRGEAYDDVEDNFDRIARYWTVHMRNHHGEAFAGFEFSPVDVAMMMALMKLARLDFQPAHHDSWVDLAGYAACGGDLAARKGSE